MPNQPRGHRFTPEELAVLADLADFGQSSGDSHSSPTSTSPPADCRPGRLWRVIRQNRQIRQTFGQHPADLQSRQTSRVIRQIRKPRRLWRVIRQNCRSGRFRPWRPRGRVTACWSPMRADTRTSWHLATRPSTRACVHSSFLATRAVGSPEWSSIPSCLTVGTTMTQLTRTPAQALRTAPQSFLGREWVQSLHSVAVPGFGRDSRRATLRRRILATLTSSSSRCRQRGGSAWRSGQLARQGVSHQTCSFQADASEGRTFGESNGTAATEGSPQQFSPHCSGVAVRPGRAANSQGWRRCGTSGG